MDSTSTASGSELVLLIDRRECQGNYCHELKLLDSLGIKYEKKTLKVGDYAWLWIKNDIKIEIPYLIERKRVDDLAKSMIDGRYNSQKKKMLAWTENFQQPNVKPKLIYLVEGQPKKFDAKCGHGCMSRCGSPKYTDVEYEIFQLGINKDFELVQQRNLSASIQYISSIHKELQKRVNSGELDCLRKQDRSVTGK